MKYFLVFALSLLGFIPSSFSNDFYGYPCTSDCSGHEAGYEWAQDKGISDSSDCGGNSNSFIEGCEAYAAEQEEDSQDDNQDDSTDTEY